MITFNYIPITDEFVSITDLGILLFDMAAKIGIIRIKKVIRRMKHEVSD